MVRHDAKPFIVVNIHISHQLFHFLWWTQIISVLNHSSRCISFYCLTIINWIIRWNISKNEVTFILLLFQWKCQTSLLKKQAVEVTIHKLELIEIPTCKDKMKWKLYIQSNIFEDFWRSFYLIQTKKMHLYLYLYLLLCNLLKVIHVCY